MMFGLVNADEMAGRRMKSKEPAFLQTSFLRIHSTTSISLVPTTLQPPPAAAVFDPSQLSTYSSPYSEGNIIILHISFRQRVEYYANLTGARGIRYGEETRDLRGGRHRNLERSRTVFLATVDGVAFEKTLT